MPAVLTQFRSDFVARSFSVNDLVRDARREPGLESGKGRDTRYQTFHKARYHTGWALPACLSHRSYRYLLDGPESIRPFMTLTRSGLRPIAGTTRAELPSAAVWS